MQFVGYFILFCLFSTPLTLAHGNSHSRGWFGAADARLHHSSQKRRILKTLNEARDRIWILLDTSRVHYCSLPLSHNGKPFFSTHLSWASKPGRRLCRLEQKERAGSGKLPSTCLGLDSTNLTYRCRHICTCVLTFPCVPKLTPKPPPAGCKQ